MHVLMFICPVLPPFLRFFVSTILRLFCHLLQVLKISDADFRYNKKSPDILKDINLKLTLGSRISIIGGNGAGKTTLIKLIVDETKPTNEGSGVWRHHNLRMSFVAQHSLFHLEQHLDKYGTFPIISCFCALFATFRAFFMRIS